MATPQEQTTDLIPLLLDPEFKDSQLTQKPASTQPGAGLVGISPQASVHAYQTSAPDDLIDPSSKKSSISPGLYLKYPLEFKNAHIFL